ncbi:hypothetical protein EFS27_07110 [Leuconostoc mesenteroides]|uniref:hypothetical protein n=1 Tax=Leuconostoc mesenteroides TaxID=1245 RepID=UPI0021A61682|nr:hypothetical protein [Leuconostoc mesenteroides]MCT3039035.1 hypothetical protein [Leuconostoc mesenteroides]
MKKGIKKAITSPAKETVITDHKRPIHGFCYTHFNMKSGKTLKVWDLDLQILSVKARNVQALAHTLNKVLQSEQLDTEYITDVVNIMEEFAIDIVNKVGEIEAEQ